MEQQIINNLHFYEYVCDQDNNEKYYIAAYRPEQADGIFMMRVMAVEKSNAKSPMRYEMSNARAELLGLRATEPGLLKVVK